MLEGVLGFPFRQGGLVGGAASFSDQDGETGPEVIAVRRCQRVVPVEDHNIDPDHPCDPDRASAPIPPKCTPDKKTLRSSGSRLCADRSARRRLPPARSSNGGTWGAAAPTVQA